MEGDEEYSKSAQVFMIERRKSRRTLMGDLCDEKRKVEREVRTSEELRNDSSDEP